MTCTDTKASMLTATALRYNFLTDIIRNYSLQKVAIILDCCYAGRAIKPAVARGNLADQVRVAVESAGSGIFFLGASGWNQTAEEREVDGHGRFTKAILDGLSSGEADTDGDGHISANDLGLYVKRRMGNAPHQPIEGGAWQGEIILGSNLRKKLEAGVHTIILSIQNNINQFSIETSQAIFEYMLSISRFDSTKVNIVKVFSDKRYLSLMEHALGRGSIDLIVRSFIEITSNEKWCASITSRGENSFSIKITKGDRIHWIEFCPGLLGDRLLIDKRKRRALRLPGTKNHHEFSFEHNIDEQFSLTYFVDPIWLAVSSIELTVNGEKILASE